MSIKELKQAIENKKVYFGIRQALKNTSGKNKIKKVFIVKDARQEAVDKLEKSKIKFDFLKSKSDVSKELNLGFDCEVFSIH
jgi:ribosomal protein L7Ae-like RNA K-turn-binding protein